MNNNPLKEFLILIAVLGLLAIPLYRLTADRTSKQSEPEQTVTMPPGVPTFGELTFTHPPSSFALKQQGKTIWSNQEPGGEIFFDADLWILAENHVVELELDATWPVLEQAVTVTLHLDADNLPTLEHTVWTDKPLEGYSIRFEFSP